MAFGAKQIFPVDKKPGVAVGVSIPFNAPAVFKSTYTTKDAIKNNLINFFLTDQPERYLNPNFGGNLRAFLFQQITNNELDNLKEEIQDQLNIFFPNVLVDQLNVDSIPDLNQVSIVLKYSIRNTGLTDEITITF